MKMSRTRKEWAMIDNTTVFSIKQYAETKYCEYHEVHKGDCVFENLGEENGCCSNCKISTAGLCINEIIGDELILLCWECFKVMNPVRVQDISTIPGFCLECSDNTGMAVLVTWNPKPYFVQHQNKIKKAGSS